MDTKKETEAQWPSGPEVLARIREETDTVMLSFSCGKDSLGCWCLLREYGFQVIPFYAAFVPGLKFVERTLAYYEDFFETHIYRTLDPNFYHWIRTYGFQPPERLKSIDWIRLPRFDYHDIQVGIARTTGLPEEAWTAVGTRMADSMNRRMSFRQHGPINQIARRFFPVYDLTKPDLIALFRKAGVKLAPDYRLFGRSFCGLDYRFLSAIRDTYPEDYERIRFWFPLVDLEFIRHKLGVQYGEEWTTEHRQSTQSEQTNRLPRAEETALTA